MNSSTLHIIFANDPAQGVTEDIWIKLEQLGSADSISKKDVAEVIDALYDIDACNGDQSDPDAEATDELPFDEEKFSEVVKNKLDPNFCNGGDTYYTVQIKVTVSHPEYPYRLRLTNGLLGQTVKKRERVTETITANGDTAVDLDNPMLDDFTADVCPDTLTDDNGGKIEVSATKTAVTFSQPVHSSAVVSYITGYDLVTIHVLNNPDGSPGECLVIGFYEGLTEELTITPPDGLEEEWLEKEKYCGPPIINFAGDDRPDDDITCYEEVTYQNRCECSDGVVDEWEERVSVPCPDRLKHCGLGMMSDAVRVGDHYECSQYLGSRTELADYVGCDIALYNPMGVEVARTSEISILSNEDYYEAQCCKPPDESLPRCQTRWEKNPGGKSPDQKTIAQYRAKWGNKVEFIGISPENNDCGTIKTTISDTARSCCDSAVPLVIDTDSVPSAISDNSQGLVYLVAPSDRPFAVTVRGTGFFADSGRSSKRAMYNGGGGFYVFTGNACGAATVTVDDGCSVATVTVRATDGQWVRAETIYNYLQGCAGTDLGCVSSACRAGVSEFVYKNEGKYKTEFVFTSYAVRCYCGQVTSVVAPIQFTCANQYFRDSCAPNTEVYLVDSQGGNNTLPKLVSTPDNPLLGVGTHCSFINDCMEYCNPFVTYPSRITVDEWQC